MERTRRQRGTLEKKKRKDGEWWYLRYWVTVFDKNGQLTPKRPGVQIGLVKQLTERQAWKIAEKFMVRLNTQEDQPLSLLSFGDYYETSYQSTLNATSLNHQATFRSSMNKHVLPALGSLNFRQITPAKVQELINVKRTQQNCSYPTLKNIAKCISAIFHHARDNEVIDSGSPTERVKLGPKTQRRPHEALSAGQVAYSSTRLKLPYSAMVLLSACVSIGPAELTGIKWRLMNLSDEEKSVDGRLLPPRSIWIAKNWTRDQLKETKTEHRNRVVPIPDLVLPMLLEWKVRSEHTRPDDFVFTASRTRTGKPVNIGKSNGQQLRRLSASLDMRVTWYTFRHTFATSFRKINAPEFDKKMLMGHSRSADMTDGYTHTEFEDLRKAANALGQRIAEALSNGRVPEKVVMIR